MKADVTRKGSTRGRGTYATQVCTVCRAKKTKCDEKRPVCGPCSSSGRDSECSWGKERGRKPRTEAHFEAMRKRADALKEYANFLESELDKCRREHGGFGASDHEGNGQSSYRNFRPKDAEGMILPDEFQDDAGDGGVLMEGEDGLSDEDEAFTQELCVPTRNLKLEEGNLLFHGNTAPFRFAPEASPMPVIPPTPTVTSVPRFGPSAPKYVLLTEDDAQNHPSYSPDFDWSRYLPSSSPLDRREHDKILDLLFKFSTSWCLRIVPDLFLQDMHRALSTPISSTSSTSTSASSATKTTHYSAMLHNALISIATAFSDDPRVRDLKARQAFAKEAKGYMERECQMPNISVVHALSVLGSFHSGLGEQTLGYLYFGMSARISQALGLSIDCSAWVRSGLISEHDMLDRNWAHWTIFTQDVCWSLYVGRDFCIPISSPSSPSRIEFPFVDAEFDQTPWVYPPSGIPPQPNLLSKTFAKSCQLLMIARRIMDVVNGLNTASVRREVNDELISSVDLQLNSWKSSLPADLDITIKSRPTATPHRLMMHCTYWWFFILLHRPFYHRRQRPLHSSDREIDHVKLCKRGAENIISLLNTWRELYTLRYAPITLVQTAFSAGTIYVLVAVQAVTGLRVAHETLKHALGQAQLCVEYLMEIGKSWGCAVRIAEILKGLMGGQVRALVERRAGRMQGPGVVMDPIGEGAVLAERKGGRRRRPSPSTRAMEEEALKRRGRTSRSDAAVEQERYTSELVMRPEHSPVHLSPNNLTHPRPMRSTSMSGMRVEPSMGMMDLSPSVDQHRAHTWGVDYSPTVTRAGSHASEGSTSSFFFDNIGLQAGPSSPSSTTSPLTAAPGTGFLAMLGGEPLSNAPFLPGSFDVYGEASDSHSQSRSPPRVLQRLSYGESYGQRVVSSTGFGGYGGYERGGLEGRSEAGGNQEGPVPMDISEEDMASLSRFWDFDQSFGSAAGVQQFF